MKLCHSRPNLLSGSAFVSLSEGDLVEVIIFGLRYMPDSDFWTGILVSHQSVIDLIVAREHVALQIEGDQVIEVDVEASDVHERADITCRNLKIGTAVIKN